MNPSQPIRMNCDAIARYYQALEYLSFGPCLERARFAFLSHTTPAKRAILCGGGDGRFLAQLLRTNPRVQVDFVDLSPAMVELARQRIARMGEGFLQRVTFTVADIREFRPRSSGYDLIATHFFLDCFSETELENVVACLARCSAPNAQWLLSEFHEANTHLDRIWTKTVIRTLYAAFRITTGLRVTRLPNYEAALIKFGYAPRHERHLLRGLLQSSLWQSSSSAQGYSVI